MTKYYDTDAFKKLNNEWKEKLKAEGFVDAEQPDGKLVSWSSYISKITQNKDVYLAKEIYYRMACRFLHEHVFDNELEQTVWEHHSKGVSLRKINKLIGKKNGTSFRIIHKLLPIMREKIKLGDEENND